MTEASISVEVELLRRLDALAKFGELALRSDNLDVILHAACDCVIEGLGADFSKVMELQEDGLTLLVKAGVGWPDGIVGKVTVKVELGSSEGYALQTGEPAISTDIDTETRFGYSDFISEAGVKALVNVIIIGSDGHPPYGILQVDSCTPRDFSERDTNYLRSYANLIAAAVERLRAAYLLRDTNALLEQRVVERNCALELERAERAVAEDKLRQAQKMEAVGQLTGGLAHDFNNLLTGITGSLAFIRKRLGQERYGDIDRYVTAAEEAARRAAAVTHRLLAFSRRQTLDPVPTEITGLVQGMEELIRQTVGPAVTLQVIMLSGLENSLVDRNQLENALLNLCINSRDAMPEGGALTITVTRHTFDEQAAHKQEMVAGDYLSLCIADTGTGMTPEVQRRAFDPFFTTKPLGAGTGLGLSMIYGFARQSGGQVALESTPGQGTTVCLFLPQHDGTEAAPDVAAPMGGIELAGHGETVLIVDDEPTVRMLVVEVLEELGYSAIQAVDGAAGMRILRSPVRIDLLITDIGLPGGMNGRQVAEGARRVRPGLKVLFITGYAEKTVLDKGLLEPGMRMLTKPFGMDALARRITEMTMPT